MKKNPTHYSILIVDDEASMRLLLQAILEGESYHVVSAQNGKEAVALIEKQKFDLILCDSRMPELDGMGVLKYLKEHASGTPFIILTAFGSVENAVEFVKMGAADYLRKPLQDPDELRLLVARVLNDKSLQNQNELLKQENQISFPCSSIVSRNAAMLRVLQLASRVAPTDTTVLVLGESGTGKELVARCIHSSSARADKIFAPVNCAALAPTLLESELFGHEKGAFTGASAQHIGRFERAHGGTLFLDEIGELDLSLQAKLLRVLEQHEFERVGGSRIITVDVRIIAATNRDLKESVDQKTFRGDLFYRLNTFPLELPPLRQRLEDLPDLAQHLGEKAAKKVAKPFKGIEDTALQTLRQYGWPGNVRELENILERAVIVSSDGIIRVGDLPFKNNETLPHDCTLAGIEKQAILSALQENQGHQRKTADQLGISLRTLQYRLREYGL
jgi:two-component system, NtrC family, response regulator AtoC